MGQRVLRVAFRIPGGLRPFRPCVSVRMEAHALHTHGATATAEFRRTCSLCRLCDLGKEWTRVRELPEQQFQSRAYLDARPLAGFPALVLEHTSLPIDVLGSQ